MIILVDMPMRQCIIIPGHLLCPSFDIIDSCYIQLQLFLVQTVKSRIKFKIPSTEAIPLATIITHLFILFYI